MADRILLSPTDPDWSREAKRLVQWFPSRSLLASIRAYQRARTPLGRSIAKWRHRLWSIVTGADIPVTVQIGGGLLLPHPNGVVISPFSTIGPNCLIFQQVTIGSTGRGTPTLMGHVDIGAGAKVIGPVTIGEHAQIGANAVVTIDVPPHGVAVGIPAQLLPTADRAPA
ncbi:MAG TPA: serine acetyltransferase [Sphingomonas sp.]|jgi:serine O-acetyltransferase|nr:serine acetyltransferase [Sphingomonas sp.]